MNLTKDEALKKINELKEYVEGLDKPKRREFKHGNDYYLLSSDGGIVVIDFDSLITFDRSAISQGNIFHTAEEAEAEKMRRESMATRFDFIPKKEESFWYWSFSRKEPTWLFFDPDFSTEWHLGSVKRTREECQEWGDKYAKYFEIPKE